MNFLDTVIGNGAETLSHLWPPGFERGLPRHLLQQLPVATMAKAKGKAKAVGAPKRASKPQAAASKEDLASTLVQRQEASAVRRRDLDGVG